MIQVEDTAELVPDQGTEKLELKIVEKSSYGGGGVGGLVVCEREQSVKGKEERRDL